MKAHKYTELTSGEVQACLILCFKHEVGFSCQPSEWSIGWDLVLDIPINENRAFDDLIESYLSEF